MSYERTTRSVQSMFGSIAERYDIANSVLSFGVHHLWKRSFIRGLPSLPSRPDEQKVLDLCTGTGDLVPLLEKRFGCTVIGGDFCEPMLDVARRRFPGKVFQFADALNLAFPDESFDLVTIAYGVRNFEDLQRGLSEIRRVLKVGGVIAVLEFGQPTNTVFRSLYGLYSDKILPVIGHLCTGDKDAYSYLNKTSLSFPSGSMFIDRLTEAGFGQAKMKSFFNGITYSYTAQKL